jgi:DUF4097 and DUF4098 domain-containing protein YvlB
MKALPALLLLCACSGGFNERVRETVHRMIATNAAPLVRVDNVAGTVRIDGWSKPSVDVDATKYGYNEQDVRQIAIDVVQTTPGNVSITTDYNGGTHSGGVRYRIFVPENASVKISNVAGAVDLDLVRGDLDVETQAGQITADAGSVAGSRSIDLRATTGAVTLTIAADSSARVEANSTVGAFSSDFSGITQQRQNIVGASGSGVIGGGTATIRLSTTTGAIALRER